MAIMYRITECLHSTLARTKGAIIQVRISYDGMPLDDEDEDEFEDDVEYHETLESAIQARLGHYKDSLMFMDIKAENGAKTDDTEKGMIEQYIMVLEQLERGGKWATGETAM